MSASEDLDVAGEECTDHIFWLKSYAHNLKGALALLATLVSESICHLSLSPGQPFHSCSYHLQPPRPFPAASLGANGLAFYSYPREHPFLPTIKSTAHLHPCPSTRRSRRTFVSELMICSPGARNLAFIIAASQCTATVPCT